MKRTRLGSIIGIAEPQDGFTDLEKKLEKALAYSSISNLYSKLPTNRMKAIVALHFELGYPQELLAEVFGVTQPRISQEISNIKKVFLGQSFRPYRVKPVKVRVEDILKFCLMCNES